MSHLFSGSIPDLVTPFDGDRVDEVALSRLVAWHAEEGSSAVLVGGTTGESSTLSDSELALIIRIARSAARGRISVIAGAGSNDTAHARHLSRVAERAGADALLHVTGDYNKPLQRQIAEHFS